MSTDLKHLIDGQWHEGLGDPVQSVNPAYPAEVVADGIAADLSQVDEAINAASRATSVWARKPIRERANILTRAAVILEERSEALGAELTREEGKTRTEGVSEVRRAAAILRHAATMADRATGQQFDTPRPGERVLVVRKPVGVVGVVTPWNFPIAIPAWKIAPALVYGNCVVWKPASLVPLLAFRFAQVLNEAGIPAGVLSLVVGPGKVGQHLAEHPGVDALSFTGSTQIGRSLMTICAAAGKPVQTEMGGKNAAVVLADADLDRAASNVVTGAMASTGQKCTATSRVVVEASVKDELLRRMTEHVQNIIVGDGMDHDVYMGPAVSEGAASSIRAHDAKARQDGAVVIAEGDCPSGDGYFVAPVVLELPHTELPIWRDEVFGPVLVVVEARDRDEAFKQANDSQFGLSGALFTSDIGSVLEAMDEIDVGVLHVNGESTGADPHVPFGGLKQSGFGPKEQGEASAEFFTQSSTIYLKA